MALCVYPSRLHACVQRAPHIGGGVIPQMQHRLYWQTQLSSRCMKNTRIGLGHPKLPSTHRGFEIRACRCTKHIRIAVGQAHQRVSGSQAFQSFLNSVIQLDVLPRGKEHLKRVVRHMRRIASTQQALANGFAP